MNPFTIKKLIETINTEGGVYIGVNDKDRSVVFTNLTDKVKSRLVDFVASENPDLIQTLEEVRDMLSILLSCSLDHCRNCPLLSKVKEQTKKEIDK